MAVLSRELSTGPVPPRNAVSDDGFYSHSEGFVLKTLCFYARRHKKLPTGVSVLLEEKYQIIEKFSYFGKSLEILSQPDWKPNLRTYSKTWEM